MARNGFIGNGLKFAYSADSPVSWTRINQIVDAGFPTWVAAEIDGTVHDENNNLERTFPGMVKVGNPFVVLLSDPDPSTSPDQDFLDQRNQDSDTFWLRIERVANRTKTQFRGIVFECAVKSFEPSDPIKDRATVRVEFLFNGDGIQRDSAVGASQIS